jgi:signal transduction histidine kinase
MNASSEKISILLVNDRPAQLLAWQAILADLNQNLVLARSGVEALEHLLAHDFAAILLDVHMPMMDGFETATLIRQRPRSELTPILFVTAVNTHERDRAQGYALGAVDYIFTPVVPEILRAKVSVFVDLYKKNQKIAVQAAQLSKLNQVLEKQLSDIKSLNDELTRTNADLTGSREQLRNLTAHVQALREEERTRIAREIHDDLGGSLTGLKMDLHQIRKSLGPGEQHLTSRLNELSQAIDQIIRNVRRIATELRPSLLDDFGLAAAIEWQLQEFEQRSGIRSQLQLGMDDLPLAPDMATGLFRVFQEALTNVARHAQATQVQVTLQGQADQLILQVRDDGRGIDPLALKNSGSLGLISMRERVQLLSGELMITGQPGEGTTVLVKIPLSTAQPQPPGNGMASTLPPSPVRP